MTDFQRHDLLQELIKINTKSLPIITVSPNFGIYAMMMMMMMISPPPSVSFVCFSYFGRFQSNRDSNV